MSTTDGVLPTVGERILAVLSHLGLDKAHFCCRESADALNLLASGSARVASLTMLGTGSQLSDFDAVSGRMLWLVGDAGPAATRMRRQLAERPDIPVRWLLDYPEFMWSDTVAERTQEVVDAVMGFLAKMDAGATPSESVALSGEGEVAGITFRAAGSGTPVVLLPLGLSARQWDPLLSQLQAQHCTVVLGGAHLQPVANLEARADSAYSDMALGVLDLAAVKADKSLIEVGCGSGALLRRIAQRIDASSVTGLDVNSFLLREARALAAQQNLADRLILRQGSAENIPFPDSSFDVTFSSTVMEEVNADRMMAELVRITRPGGRVVVVVRAVDRPLWTNLQLPAGLRDKVEHGGAGGRAQHGCADESLYRRFRDAGLQAIRGGPSWACVQLSEPYWRNVEDRVIATLTSEEAQEWRRCVEAARTEGLPAWIARPFHCAVGLK